MKHLYPKNFLIQLLALAVVITFSEPASAQCPVGSIANSAGSYNSGQTACISNSSFSGNITLNSGSRMVVVSGGNFTANINANSGSKVDVYAGGIFNPNNANNFAAALAVKKSATAILGTGNISLSSGFSLLSQGSVTWAKAWTQNFTQSVTNGSCGTMIFTQATSLQNNSTLINSGIVVMQGTLTTNSGTTINNRGSLTVNGAVTLSGYLNNQWKTVFKSASGNIFNTGDSVINLYTMVFSSAVIGTVKMRNDGLLWVRGSMTLNGGTGLNMKVTNAQFRVDGALANNGVITGTGSSMYVAGGLASSGTVQGLNSGQKLRLNTAPVGGTVTNTTVAALTAMDTTSFIGGQGNPALCAMVLPMEVTALKGVLKEDAVLLTWATLTELNGKNFVVEYSTDGIAFTAAGEVAAKGNSNVRVEYSYLFPKITGSTLYFRLKTVDIDGDAAYTNMVLVKTGTAQAITASVYPNPFTEKVEVALTAAGTTEVAIKLFDMNGRMVKSQLYNGQSGNNKFVLTGLSGLKPGLYVLQVSAGEEKWMQKVIR
jgi:hypothetical protein